MMKTRILFIFLIASISGVYAQNLQLRSNLSYGATALANIGDYVDSLGNEYALVGTDFGVSIVDVTNPAAPVIKFSVNGPSSIWREIKTYRKYAYVTTEGGGGLQIINLSNLPATITSHSYTGDGAISGQLSSIHALHCDTATGYLYLYGSSINSGNTLFLNLNTDPYNPVYAGQYIYPGTTNDQYVHDGYVLNDTMYEAHIYPGFFAVVDVRNKMAPVLLATQNTPTNFTHNTWLSDNHKTLFTTDENNGSFIGAFDISDLSNIHELSRFQTVPGSNAIVHNTHVLNDFTITSWYTEGVVITDMARPDNPIQVGKYDTYPGSSVDGFNGCWGVDPFLPSGNIIASDIDGGLFVFTPTYIRGCYLEGQVTDSMTGIILNGAQVEILTTPALKLTDLSGNYKTGLATSGTYDVKVSKAGYYPKTITGVTLNNGILTTLNVELVPFQTYAFSGSVIDSVTGLGVSNAEVVISSASGLIYKTRSDASGNLAFSAVVPDDYIIYTGKWGYKTICQTQTLVVGNPINSVIAPGYYDDFTFNYNWTVSGTSANSWERGEPIGTFDGNGTEINPEFDVNSDCGDTCFVTDNGGAPFNSNDVDNGNTILTSPIFDGTIYQAPVLSYFRRYLCINGTGAPNDTMKISLSNGTTTVLIESIAPNNPTNGTWVQQTALISSFLPVTNTMQMIVEVADNTPGNIVEGALDKFEITGSLINSVSNILPGQELSIFPNPFSNSAIVNYSTANYGQSIKLIVKDVLGRIVYQQNGLPNNGTVSVGSDFIAGVYLVQIINGTEILNQKMIKK